MPEHTAVDVDTAASGSDNISNHAADTLSIESRTQYTITMDRETPPISSVSSEDYMISTESSSNDSYDNATMTVFESDKSDIPQELPEAYKIKVKNILQAPELPMGCEIVSLTIVLNYLGYDVDKMYMADNYLTKVDFWKIDGKLYGADPMMAFPGDPAEPNSSGCFAPVIVDSANRFFADNDSEHEAIDTSDKVFTELLHEYIDNDIPVIIWVTGDELHEIVYKYSWETPSGKTIDFPSYQHCVVMTGYDLKKEAVYVSDPLVGNTSYDIELFQKRYNELGSNSVIIRKIEGAESNNE
ncbi:MAG: C39 family peptidase [Ruminococcus sp.]|nr:C39 family peptidase [Ruminococcus sp.]